MCQKTKKRGESAVRTWHRQQQIRAFLEKLRTNGDAIKSRRQSLTDPQRLHEVFLEIFVHRFDTR